MAPSQLDTWVIGAIINLVGSVAINTGVNIIKLYHVRSAEVRVCTPALFLHDI